jgi:sulfide:quinone oxidoreductase
MAKTKVLIAGAGASGTITANKLARELRREIADNQVEVTVLDKDDVNTNQAGFTFIPFGLYTEEDIRRPRRKLISPRVRTVFGQDGEITKIDLKNREVTVKTGNRFSYDYLLLATGCQYDTQAVPGLSADFNSFYPSLEDAFKLGDKLKSFDKGRIVVLTPSMPIPCPGAPGKFTILLDDYLRYVKGGKGREGIQITFLWPTPLIGPAAYNTIIDGIFNEKDISCTREFKLSQVDADKKEVVSADGKKIGYDLLITVPPCKSVQPLLESGIADEKGWVPTDKYSLQYNKPEGERHDEVYAIGDTGPVEILKTGIGAHYQALITAENLIHDVRGVKTKVPYRGETGCPFVASSYTTHTEGKAYIASWTYNRPLQPFKATNMGWFVYRMYYYIYWDMTAKSIL